MQHKRKAKQGDLRWQNLEGCPQSSSVSRIRRCRFVGSEQGWWGRLDDFSSDLGSSSRGDTWNSRTKSLITEKKVHKTMTSPTTLPETQILIFPQLLLLIPQLLLLIPQLHQFCPKMLLARDILYILCLLNVLLSNLNVYLHLGNLICQCVQVRHLLKKRG